MKQRVLIGSRSFGKSTPLAVEKLVAAGCEVIPNTRGRSYRQEELREILPEVDAFITGLDELTAHAIETTTRLRVISKHGVGLDNIDIPAAKAKGIVVTATLNAIHDSVADLTLALLLALARNIVPAHNTMQAGKWEKFIGTELRGKSLGIIGLGQIGKQVALRAQAFGMSVCAYDVYQDESFAAAHGIEFVALDELLARADFVSLHAALSFGAGTLFGARELARMKPTAFLLNTARGGLLDEAALVEALRAKTIAGAALDVFAHEPLTDSALGALDNVILTPHIAGQTREGLARMDDIAAENVLAVLRGEKPLFQL